MLKRFVDKIRLQAQALSQPAPPSDNLVRTSAHIGHHFGKQVIVLHEKVSPLVHVDVYVVQPSPDRPFFTLLTSGMSDREMCVPEGSEALAFLELTLGLPGDWPLRASDPRWS